VTQNSVIFAALLIGFIVYITVKGRLSAYLALFYTQQSKPSQAAQNAASQGLASPGTVPIGSVVTNPDTGNAVSSAEVQTPVGTY
jgi:preprotein translocase subunit SecY